MSGSVTGQREKARGQVRGPFSCRSGQAVMRRRTNLTKIRPERTSSRPTGRIAPVRAPAKGRTSVGVVGFLMPSGRTLMTGVLTVLRSLVGLLSPGVETTPVLISDPTALAFTVVTTVIWAAVAPGASAPFR